MKRNQTTTNLVGSLEIDTPFLENQIEKKGEDK